MRWGGRCSVGLSGVDEIGVVGIGRVCSAGVLSLGRSCKAVNL